MKYIYMIATAVEQKSTIHKGCPTGAKAKGRDDAPSNLLPKMEKNLPCGERIRNAANGLRSRHIMAVTTIGPNGDLG